ncbi:MAG: ABC transporter permease, partial [Flavobacteriales bacterium]|nr:ABC transporter permease [Flavobacteriales bacterium]
MQIFTNIGRYALLMASVFRRPEKWKIFYRLTVLEIDKIGVQSV